MNGWIIYKRSQAELTLHDHGVNRLLERAASHGMRLSVYREDEFELIAGQDKPYLLYQNERVELPDFVLPRLGANTSYHALMLLHVLSGLGVYVANSPESIGRVKDKMQMSIDFSLHGIPSPKTWLVQFPADLAQIEHEIGFPLVVKNISGAKGIGVYLTEKNGFEDLMGLLATHAREQILLQSFIKSSYGRDLRVFVLGKRVIGCMMRQAVDGFKANYSLGGQVQAYPVSDEIETLALKVTQLFGLEIAGIDLLFGPDGFLVCEANSSPGFKGMEEATGKDVAGEILNHVARAVRNRR